MGPAWGLFNFLTLRLTPFVSYHYCIMIQSFVLREYSYSYENTDSPIPMRINTYTSVVKRPGTLCRRRGVKSLRLRA
eukprot:2663725-Rhodomonas_salina.2